MNAYDRFLSQACTFAYGPYRRFRQGDRLSHREWLIGRCYGSAVIIVILTCLLMGLVHRG